MVHESSADVPDTYSIIDTKTWTCCCRKNMLSIGAPLDVRAIGGLDGADLCVVLVEIVDVHMTSQISKSSNKDESSMG